MSTRRTVVILITAGVLLIVLAGFTYRISKPGPEELDRMRYCSPFPSAGFCALAEMGVVPTTAVIVMAVLGVLALGLAVRAWLHARTS
ncbi:hypothetical protein [Actinokineospora spheciospongiae]|nr:hypothetical protein [Actinokineospora spheciospongiae]